MKKTPESINNQLELKSLAATVNPILRKHGVKTAAVFGSVARGEATRESDIDFLVEYNDGTSILDAIRLRHELEQTLGRDVDLVSRDYVRPFMAQEIFSQAIPIMCSSSDFI